MSTIVYSTAGCSFCVDAKLLLNEYNIDFEEIVLGEDLEVQTFAEQFPGIFSVPFIVLDDKQILGYDELKTYLEKV